MTLKKLSAAIILTFILTIAYQVLGAYMTSPEGLQYPNPGHHPGEIGPGTFNDSGEANPYWSFPGNLNVSGNVTVSGQNVCLENGKNCPISNKSDTLILSAPLVSIEYTDVIDISTYDAGIPAPTNWKLIKDFGSLNFGNVRVGSNAERIVRYEASVEVQRSCAMRTGKWQLRQDGKILATLSVRCLGGPYNWNYEWISDGAAHNYSVWYNSFNGFPQSEIKNQKFIHFDKYYSVKY